MKLIKPEPLVIGGRAHYTLSSYDPVTIEVTVPYITDADVDLSLAAMAREAGGTMADLKNDAWVAENFEGVSNLAELRRYTYDEVRTMASEMAENEKAALCASKLAERLEQSVPQASLEKYGYMVRQSFMSQLAASSMTLEEFAAASGMTRSDVEHMLEAEAEMAAENEAALDAWADHRQLKVSDEELPRLLGLTPSDAEEFLQQANAAGQLANVRQAALRSKALEIVLAECTCTYIHETPAEAAIRNREMRAQQGGLSLDEPESSASSSHPHLKLV